MEARVDSVDGRVNPPAVSAIRVKKKIAPGPSTPPSLVNEEEEKGGWCEGPEKGTYDAASSLP